MDLKDNQQVCAIIIPIYKEFLNDLETISLLQVLRILKNYPFCFISYEELDKTFYENIIAKNKIEVKFDYVFFESKYFDSIAGYNELLLSSIFFNSFSDFKYILIHQLDCFIFKDELAYWCSQDYDYIGAPWLDVKLDRHQKERYRFKGVGNGGFSLRKVSSHIFYLNLTKNLESFTDLMALIFVRLNVSRIEFKNLRIIKALIYQDVYFSYLKNWSSHEDQFWEMISSLFMDFQTPKPEKAMRFSFEANPEYLYALNKNNLPFGCHAWLKFDLNFWRPFIEKYNYSLNPKLAKPAP